MWQGIHGHDAVAERFRHSLACGRMAASYLFLGPEGIGKRTFAIRLAQALVCQSSAGGQLEPCGQCDSCQLMLAGNHPDVDVVGLPKGKRWLPVDLFLGDREHRNQEGLCHNLSLRPQMGRRRVAIIDDADFLTVESANCLLKTLEEPPAGAVMILIGTSRGRQLPTILSRTQTVRFAPLSVDSVRHLVLQQQIAKDEHQAEQLAQAGEGSLTKAAELVDPQLWEMQQTLLPQLTPTRFDSVRLAGELTTFVSQAGKEAEPRRQRIRRLIRIFASHFRQLLRAACSPDGANEAQFGECQSLGSAAQDLALDALDRCLEAETQLDRNANQATLIECWLDDLATLFSRHAPTAKTAR
ncbi:MAG: DNA polymerase III subunit [Planctomycetota bacterium]